MLQVLASGYWCPDEEIFTGDDQYLGVEGKPTECSNCDAVGIVRAQVVAFQPTPCGHPEYRDGRCAEMSCPNYASKQVTR